MVDEANISKAIDLLRQAAQPTRIILFGSRGRSEARAESDIDVLIVMRQVSNRVAEMVRLSRILSPLRLPFDLLVVSEETFRYWADTPGNVYHAAMTEGRVLYEQAA